MQTNVIQEISVRNLLSLLRKRTKRIALIVSMVVVLVVVYTFIQPKEYRASTVVVMTDESLPGMASMLQNMPGASLLGQGGSTRAQAYTEIVKSREIAKFIADTLNIRSLPELASLPEDKFYQAISATISTKLTRGGLLEISASISTPWFASASDELASARLAADIANAAALGLDKYNQDKSSSKARRKRVFAEKMLTTKKVELDSIDLALESFRKQNKLLALETQSQATVSQAVTTGAELAKAQIELQTKLLEYGEDAAVIEVYRKKVTALRNQFQKLQNGGLAEGDKVTIPLGEVPSISRRYVTMVRDQKILEQVIAYLESQKYQEGIQEASDLPTVEQLDKALVPTERSAPNRKLAVMLAFFLSFVGTALYYTAKEIHSGALIIRKNTNSIEI